MEKAVSYHKILLDFFNISLQSHKYDIVIFYNIYGFYFSTFKKNINKSKIKLDFSKQNLCKIYLIFF
jgi:DNA polymerase elongation subunit (family B)